MAEAAQPKNEPEESPLSPWWIRSVLIVMVGGFAGLVAITQLAYRNAPPIPGRVVDANGTVVFSGDDISNGQAVFLRYGLMDNGTIWGHGAYLGPDYSAEALHRIGEDTATALARQQYGKPVSDLTPTQTAAIRAEVAVTLKLNRYDAASNTLQLTAPEAAAYRQQIGYWTDLLPRPGQKWRPQGRPHHRSGRAAPAHRVHHLGGVGLGRRSSGRRLLLYQQFPVRPRCRQCAGSRRVAMERAQSGCLARRHCGGPAGIRQIRLSRLDHPRSPCPPAGDSWQREPRPARAGQVLCRGVAAVPDADAGRWRGRTLPRRSGQFLRIAPRTDFPQQPAAHLAFADRDLLDRHRLRGRRLVPRTFAARGRAALDRGCNSSALRRVCAGHRRQPARRVVGHVGPARRRVVLVRQPGLGIPGNRPLLAVRAGGRIVGVVRDAVVAGVARYGRQCEARPLARVFLYALIGDPGVLHTRTPVRRQDQFHRGRHLALLDHPLMGGRFLRILRHDDRCADVFSSWVSRG